MKAQLTVRIPDELEQELSVLAQRLRLKRSDVVRLALEKFVAESRGETEQHPYDRVKDLIGSTASEIPDLGERHREHLLARFGKHA